MAGRVLPLCAFAWVTLLVGCNNGGASEQSQAVAEECTLLTDAEINDVIGPHGAAEADLYFGGCAWYASVAPTETGFRPGVIVAVVPDIVFRQVAHVGEAVEGFGSDATYDPTHGELWFRCRGEMHCGLKLQIADSDRRAAEARRLGLLVRERA